MRICSEFGKNLASGSGIEELMEDLGHALAEGGDGVLMLGGGNPAHIPEAEALWKERLLEIVNDPHLLRRVTAVYDPPKGNSRFLQTMAKTLRQEYGWDIGPENLAITAGGQSAFFFLFNLLAGPTSSESRRRTIHFPVMPEYIGYANQGISSGMLSGSRPRITRTGPHSFKYHVDFDSLQIHESVAALCVSRPTNPSGNVLDDQEMEHLSSLTASHGIPLIVDNAYGHPFPGILFREVRPTWKPHHIFILSLSKLGLPGTRTAVVVAEPEVCRAVASLTAVTGLANGNFGQAMVRPLLEDGRLLALARNHIQPFYQRKMMQARQWVKEFFPSSTGYALHETEGAMFLWLWLEGCPTSSRQLYLRLKKRRVLVVPGDPFFFGLSAEEDWKHRHECLRISFAGEEKTVREGLCIIAEEVGRAFEL